MIINVALPHTFLFQRFLFYEFITIQFNLPFRTCNFLLLKHLSQTVLRSGLNISLRQTPARGIGRLKDVHLKDL